MIYELTLQSLSLSEGTIIYRSHEGRVSFGNIILTDGQTCDLRNAVRNIEEELFEEIKRSVNDPPSFPEITTTHGVALIKLDPINHCIN